MIKKMDKAKIQGHSRRFYRALMRVWWSKSPSLLAFCLLPFSWLYRLAIFGRDLCYRFGVFRVVYAPVPVIVVGNITVGGSGKTPAVIALVARLKAEGRRPGILTRGYGGVLKSPPYLLNDSHTADLVGDEPVLLHRHTSVPVVVDPKRTRGLRYLLAQCPSCDVIVCDDGLQHRALHADIRIALVDAKRGVGNGYLLPAGPLRERISQLNTVDIVIYKGGETGATLKLVPVCFVNIHTGERLPLKAFFGQAAYAIAGIGDPDPFFDTLRGLGVQLKTRVFRDHHAYVEADLQFPDVRPIIMTEKDAVKCALLPNVSGYYLAVRPELKGVDVLWSDISQKGD